MHGCYNRFPSYSYPVQDGWTSDGRRIMIEHKNIHIIDGNLPCKYQGDHADDPGCNGCVHKTDNK